MPLTLQTLSGDYAVCQLPPDAPFPNWAQGDELLALVRTADEVSVVCEQRYMPDGVRAEKGWRALKVVGPLDFALVGILASLAGVLAQVGVSIFVLSTFDTDYLLVKADDLETATDALEKAGHKVLK
jgi:hypothetical protein